MLIEWLSFLISAQLAMGFVVISTQLRIISEQIKNCKPQQEDR